jgi:hypothetical protein
MTLLEGYEPLFHHPDTCLCFQDVHSSKDIIIDTVRCSKLLSEHGAHGPALTLSSGHRCQEVTHLQWQYTSTCRLGRKSSGLRERLVMIIANEPEELRCFGISPPAHCQVCEVLRCRHQIIFKPAYEIKTTCLPKKHHLLRVAMLHHCLGPAQS